MPLVRISLVEGKSADYRRKIGEAVHQALVETIDVPPADRFQLLSAHAREDFVYDPAFLTGSPGARRSDELVMIQLTIAFGRSLEKKRALYRAIVARLGATVGLAPGDVLINLVEVARENWSFGGGIASYAPEETAAAA